MNVQVSRIQDSTHYHPAAVDLPHQFEISALTVAIETIQEIDELRNTSVQQRKRRSSSMGAQETACDWRSVRERTRRIAPNSAVY